MEKMANDYDETINTSSPDSDENNSSSNYINYGPIRFFGRKGRAPTLSTGRKSKFEELHGEALIEREHRRERNRLLSKRLKEKRESILSGLLQQVNQLEAEHSHLLYNIEQMEAYRKDLSHKLENVNQDPLLNLINENRITLFFEQYADLDIDTDSLISTLSSEGPNLDDFLSEESH